MIPYKLDLTIEKVLADSKPVAGVEKSFLTGIRDHKWLVSERLGRDVGMTVAVLDYFLNIHRLPSMPNTAN